MALGQWVKIFLLIAIGIAFGNGSLSLQADDASIPPSLLDQTSEDSMPPPLTASEFSSAKVQGAEGKSLLYRLKCHYPVLNLRFHFLLL
jgi:hypothetical protein